MVDPTGKTSPEDGLQTGATEPEQVPWAVTVKFTVVPAGSVVNTFTFGEQTIVGGMISPTVTV